MKTLSPIYQLERFSRKGLPPVVQASPREADELARLGLTLCPACQGYAAVGELRPTKHGNLRFSKRECETCWSQGLVTVAEAEAYRQRQAGG